MQEKTMERDRSVGRRTTSLAGAATRGAHEGRGRRLVLSLAAGLGLGLAVSAASAQTIVDEWATVKAPPAPELKAVNLDPKTTALLMLDFVAPNCTQRPRCMASVPAVKKLLVEARAKGVLIVYSTGATGTRADTVPELAPTDSEPLVSTGVDKFANTDLEKILKAGGTQTVIAMGTAAQGAVLYTASAASMRGMKVIVPVDGMSSDIPYGEQYTAWHLANAPVVSRNVTLTKLELIKF
jgi:nicotinamidase-related amidase